VLDTAVEKYLESPLEMILTNWNNFPSHDTFKKKLTCEVRNGESRNIKKSCCPEQIQFITEDKKVKHINITFIYNWYKLI
jgi:hypothetical protein